MKPDFWSLKHLLCHLCSHIVSFILINTTRHCQSHAPNWIWVLLMLRVNILLRPLISRPFLHYLLPQLDFSPSYWYFQQQHEIQSWDYQTTHVIAGIVNLFLVNSYFSYLGLGFAQQFQQCMVVAHSFNEWMLQSKDTQGNSAEEVGKFKLIYYTWYY